MNDQYYQRGYELGFDDGYNKAVEDLRDKYQKYVNEMIEKISKDLNR